MECLPAPVHGRRLRIAEVTPGASCSWLVPTWLASRELAFFSSHTLYAMTVPITRLKGQYSMLGCMHGARGMPQQSLTAQRTSTAPWWRPAACYCPCSAGCLRLALHCNLGCMGAGEPRKTVEGGVARWKELGRGVLGGIEAGKGGAGREAAGKGGNKATTEDAAANAQKLISWSV